MRAQDPHVTMMDLRARLGEIVDRVRLRSERFIVERKGEEMAAVVPVGHLRRIEEYAHWYALDAMARMARELAASEDEIDSVVDEAIRQVRSGRRKR